MASDGMGRPFAIDLDGTFYTKDAEVMARNYSALVQLRKQGIEAFYCTGRTLASALGLLGDCVERASGYRGYPGVYCNGAHVHGKDGQLLEAHYFSRNVLLTIIDYIIAHGHEASVIFFGKEHDFVLTNNPSSVAPVLGECSTIASLRIIDAESLKQQDILRIECLGFDVLNFDLKTNVDYVVLHMDGFFQMLPPGVNKAQGIRAIARELQVKPEEIAFIGDAINDIEAMQQSNYSFAVGNATEDIKTCAKNILKATNHQGAFCDAVQQLYQI